MVCVLLVGIAGTAQAAHIHGQWLPQHGAELSLPADAALGQGEEHCSLCVAMHSALPWTQAAAAEGMAPVVLVPTAFERQIPKRPWTLGVFSRPPPRA
jgi:hypothetical protein